MEIKWLHVAILRQHLTTTANFDSSSFFFFWFCCFLPCSSKLNLHLKCKTLTLWRKKKHLVKLVFIEPCVYVKFSRHCLDRELFTMYWNTINSLYDIRRTHGAQAWRKHFRLDSKNQFYWHLGDELLNPKWVRWVIEPQVKGS